jgi:hypothetical protein
VRTRSSIRASRCRPFAKHWHVILSAASSVAFTRICAANNETYTGPDGGDFATPSNWNTSVAPNSGDTVVVGADDGINPSFTVNFDYQSSNYSSGGFNSLTIDSPSPLQDITVSEAPAGSTVYSLSTNTLIVGNANEGDFVQAGTSGSTDTISGSLILAAAINSVGEYDLDNGSLNASALVVASAGTGTFVQGNGTNSTVINMAIGQLTGSSGTYLMEGGSLSSTAETYGVETNSTGNFVQSGGTHTITGSMLIGELPSITMSSYELESGTLLVGNAIVGYGGTGQITQSGGVSTVTGNLQIGGQNGLMFQMVSGTGSYTLNGTGATMSAATLSIGVTGSGSFSQSAGAAVVGSLIIQGGTGTGNLTQSGGTFTATTTANSGTIEQTGGMSSLGAVTGTGTMQVGGSATVNSITTVASISQSSLSVSSNGMLTISPNSPASNILDSLQISGSGDLNIGNNALLINYGAGPDPIASIQSWIASGYAGGSWTGSGIMSTAAQSNSGSYGIGYADSADKGNPANLPSGMIEIMYTLLGDANLDGKVNGADFAIMAANFNQGGKSWDQGDFNYDFNVNGADFTLLAKNFNQSATQSAAGAADLAALDAFAAANGINLAGVPEPATTVLLTLGALSALARRRRRPPI